jgi:hypothetical protein
MVGSRNIRQAASIAVVAASSVTGRPRLFVGARAGAAGDSGPVVWLVVVVMTRLLLAWLMARLMMSGR